jgi:hypothetical protein
MKYKFSRDKILEIYWFKVLNEIKDCVKKGKDSKIKDFTEKLESILPNIRTAVLLFYTRRCRDIHNIAFF